MSFGNGLQLRKIRNLGVGPHNSGQELAPQFRGGLMGAGVVAAQQLRIDESWRCEHMLSALLPKDSLSEGIQHRDRTVTVREQPKALRDVTSPGRHKY